MVIFFVIGIGFCAFGYVGYKLAIGLFSLIFPERKQSTYTFVDNSVHHHHHEHKSIHIIDDTAKENIINNLN